MEFHAHCICPDFLYENINNLLLTNYILSKNTAFVIDNKGILFNHYTKLVSNDKNKYELLFALKTQIDNYYCENKNKIILVDTNKINTINELIVDITKNARTLYDKSILTSNNEVFYDYIDELRSQRISVYTINNIDTLINTCIIEKQEKKLSYNKLDRDINYALDSLVRDYNINKKEDELNDLVRIILGNKYNVKDQSREGISSSGISSGELDIVIEDDNRTLFTIIEAMRLSSIKKSTIDTHYKKLMTNYNPLGIKITYLITYYYGSKFNNWWESYKGYIENIPSELFNFDDIKLFELKEEKLKYLNIKKAIHGFEIDGSQCHCIHYAVKLKEG
jgi:hypothetical protein